MFQDKFDNNPNNGDWRDDLLVIVGVIFLLAFFSVLVLAGIGGRGKDNVLFYVGITLLVLGVYIRLVGKKARTERLPLPKERIKEDA